MYIPLATLSYRGMGIATSADQTEFWVRDLDTCRARTLTALLNLMDALEVAS